MLSPDSDAFEAQRKEAPNQLSSFIHKAIKVKTQTGKIA
jgi:hypothetical protein